MSLLSIYPTVQFIRWNRTLKEGRAITPDASTLATVRTLLHLELVGVVLILLCAALMARGIGNF